MPRILEWSAIMPSVARTKDSSALHSQPPRSSFTRLAVPKLWSEQILSPSEFRVILAHSCWTWQRRSAPWGESLLSNTAEKRFRKAGRSTKTVIRLLILKLHCTVRFLLPEDQKATDLVSPSGCSPACCPECRPAERFLVPWIRNIDVLSETCSSSWIQKHSRAVRRWQLGLRSTWKNYEHRSPGKDLSKSLFRAIPSINYGKNGS